jgi:hypothetical protein
MLVGKPERKRPVGRPRHGWHNIKNNLKEIRCDGVEWIQLAKYRSSCWKF